MHASPDAPHTHFDHGAWMYDVLPVPTHAKALRRALAGATGPLVDLGGGTAKYTVRFTDAALRPVVTDPSRPMMEQAVRRRRPVRLVQAVGHRLPYHDASLGAVTATEAFHHFVPEQETTIAECARVLRPDGVLVIEEPDPSSLLGRIMKLGERAGRLGSEFHTPDALEAMARRHFADVTTTRSGLFTYLLTARTPTAAAPQPL